SALSPAHPEHGQHYGIFLVELGVGITVSAVMMTIYFLFSVRPRVGSGVPR
ncbi:MAG: multicomponent Na+:H+ antiporter subunit B, partial [Polyangiales bacterium]